jgi:hypothetical protein
VPVKPTRDLELPVPERREVEIVTPGSAATLLAVLPNPDRAIWATAFTRGCDPASCAPFAGKP